MSHRVLVTAFGPYGSWPDNSSWLALVEFTKSITPRVAVTTRLYPVDFDRVRQKLEEDLLANYDFALHLGQAPGTAQIRLEAVGLNMGGNSRLPTDSYAPLVADGPVAYRSALPLGDWARRLREQGIPATVSYHAGTYLCNATLYLAHYFAAKYSLKTRAAFVHLPLADSQAARESSEVASLSPVIAARALDLMMESLVTRELPQALS